MAGRGGPASLPGPRPTEYDVPETSRMFFASRLHCFCKQCSAQVGSSGFTFLVVRFPTVQKAGLCKFTFLLTLSSYDFPETARGFPLYSDHCVFLKLYLFFFLMSSLEDARSLRERAKIFSGFWFRK